jgi:regulator of cell morphogenesis and NO signaling
MNQPSIRIPRVDEARSVNELLRDHPETAVVFNAFGIDACCGGARSLRDAAADDGADLAILLGTLERTIHQSRVRP